MSNSSSMRWVGVLGFGFFLLHLSPPGFAQNVINTDRSTLNLSVSPLAVDGNLTNSYNSTVTVNGSMTGGSLIPSLLVTGNLSNSFDSTVTESGLVSGDGLVAPAIVKVDGNLTNDGSATVQIQNQSLLSVGGNVINSGQFLTGNASGDVGFNSLVIGGMFINNAGGMLSLNASGDTLYAGALANAGYMNVANGAVVSLSGALTQTAGAVNIQPGGSIDLSNYLVNGGTLQIDGALSASSVTLGSGILDGAGSIDSTIANNSGIVEPGAPGAPNPLNLTGDFTQSAEGTFIEQIGPSGGEQLLDTGNVGLNGTLEISLMPEFIPPIGAQYLFIDFSGTLKGAFADVIGSEINNCEDFAVIYQQYDVELVVEATGNPGCAEGEIEGGGPNGQGSGPGGEGGGPGGGIPPLASAPEPSSLLLLAGVALSIAGYGRKRCGSSAQVRTEAEASVAG